MISLELLRRNPEHVKEAIKRRGEETSLDQILLLDTQLRSLVTERDKVRSQHNELSRQFAELRKEGTGRSRAAMENRLRQEIQALMKQIQDLETERSQVQSQLNDLLLFIPNIPLVGVPDGLDETGNQVVREIGIPREFSFTPLAHWDLGEKLQVIDLQRGAKLAGARFAVLKGAGAVLERALENWMLDLHLSDHGYTEVHPPFLVREEILVGSGNLPKFGDNLYRDVEEDLWLIPTAEVPLTNLYRDEILEAGVLPLYYVSCTPCFRREKTAAGRDTRGIKRVHQFNKVEMYKFVEPEQSETELERLVADAEEVCRSLGLAYRVVKLCAGDMGFPSAMTYDLEVWAPGCGEWLEVSSCSNCTDFQARRANIRYRPAKGARPEFLHTINGSGLALPRILIAVLENYQQEDGSVLIPEVLQRYTTFSIIIPP